ncbi:MAG: hypothetical protein CMK00_07685 [Planctomycetes bacterium]|nr:hypothetical protein [Planctomycetota bacterium]
MGVFGCLWMAWWPAGGLGGNFTVGRGRVPAKRNTRHAAQLVLLRGSESAEQEEHYTVDDPARQRWDANSSQ